MDVAQIELYSTPREVRGIVLFASRDCDAQTAPWAGIFPAVYLDVELQRLQAS